MAAIFWWYGFEELAPDSGGFNLAGYTVFGSHLIHVFLMWDFLFCYGKAIMEGKLLHKEFDFGGFENL